MSGRSAAPHASIGADFSGRDENHQRPGADADNQLAGMADEASDHPFRGQIFPGSLRSNTPSRCCNLLAVAKSRKQMLCVAQIWLCRAITCSGPRVGSEKKYLPGGKYKESTWVDGENLTGHR